MDIANIIKNFGTTDIMSLFLSFWIGIVIFIWIRSILWVTKDISLRTDNIFLQILSIFLVTVLTPIIGVPLHFLIRPIQYKYDKNGWRQALIANSIECANCGKLNTLSSNYCSYCGEGLKIQCKECKEKYSYEWDYCGNCGAPNLEVEE